MAREEGEEREDSAGLRCVFYHACTGVSLTTSKVWSRATQLTGPICAIKTVKNSKFRLQM